MQPALRRVKGRPTGVLLASTLIWAGCDDDVNIRLLSRPGAEVGPEPSLVDTSAYSSSSIALEGDAEASPSEQTPTPPGDSGGDAALGLDEIPPSSLIHHYDFSGEGNVVRDVVGGADGVLEGGTLLDGRGSVLLDGVDDFVDLPNGLISSLSAASIALWVQWHGGSCWQRLFDFGSSTADEGTPASAETSLFVTPRSCPSSHLGPVEDNVLSLMFHAPGSYSLAQDTRPLPSEEPALVVLSIDDDGTLQVFVDDAVVVNLMTTLHLSDLRDENNWIGRSQWGHDPTLGAEVFDLKIYDVALSLPRVQRLRGETLPLR